MAEPISGAEVLRRVANAVPALLAFVDRDARYVWGNEAYREWCGVPPEELAGKTPRDVLGPTAWEAVQPYVERALAGEAISFETRMHYRGGPARDVRAEYVPQRDERGEVIGFVALVHDISDRRAAEQQLRDALEEVRTAARRKDEFLAMLSHELRNPLSPILSAAEVLQRSPHGVPAETRQIYGILARQALHMRRLLDDLLEISRVSQGKVELRKQPTELREILAQAIEVCQPLVTAKRHTLVRDFGSRPLVIDGDAVRLVQVFANLLTNAAKYTDHGGTITLSATADAGDAVIRVRDTGIGMTEAMLSRAFELFEQETRALDRAQGGLGIGLTMVRSLVTMHGGTVVANSPGLGRGSELTVRLPLLA